jgi:hypothetical protein
MFKKLVASILLAVYLLTVVFVPIAHAQSNTWYNQGFEEWSSKVFDESNPQEIFGERYTFAQVQWIVYSLAAILSGTDLLKCAELATEKTKGELENCVNNLKPVQPDKDSSTLHLQSSILGLASLGDLLLSIKPASGIKYVYQKAASLKIVPEAYAQEGFGFSSLAPVQKIWQVTRNMSYSLLILVILAMAFMIMFRVKISPQTIITVQSALPKIIGILLLITFSYAIAGFVIDLSYLVIGIIAAFAKNGGLAANYPSPTEAFGTIGLAQKMWGGAWSPLSSLIIAIGLPLVLVLVIGGGILAGTSTILLPGTGFVFGFLGAALILLLFFAFILYTFFKIIWTMLKALVNIILLIIFGPFLILIGGVTSTGGFAIWLKNLIANVAVFPVIAIMAFLAHVLYWSAEHPVMDFFGLRGTWLNPFKIAAITSSGEFALPLYNLNTFWLSLFVAMGILFLMPSAADLIKSIISGQPFAYGTAIGQAFTPLGWAWGMGPSQALGAYREAAGKNKAGEILQLIYDRTGAKFDRLQRLADKLKA